MIYNSAKNMFHKLFSINKILSIFIVIFVNFSHNAYSSELDNLFLKLKQSTNPALAMDYEAKIWNLWLNNGSSKKSNSQMQRGLELLQNGKLDRALSLFKNLSKKDPIWAEPINKIATIKFLQGDYIGSINDIKSTLKLEPRHFGAISGLVQINIILKEYKQALKNLDYVLKIHPFIGIKKLKPYIQNLLNKSSI